MQKKTTNLSETDTTGAAQEQFPAPAEIRSGIRSRRFAIAELFGRAQEVIIEHNGRDYRLRLTAQGKLLLTA